MTSTAASADRSPEIIVEKYNLLEVKPVLDDCLRSILSQVCKYDEINRFSNTKMFIGYLASIIATSTAYYGWIMPFSQSRFWTLVGVSVYFVLNGIYMLYVLFAERSTVFEGRRKSDKRHLIVSTRLSNFDPIYHIHFAFDTDSSFAIEGENSVGSWIDVNGKFMRSKFETFVQQILGKHGVL